jgi:hypothetical protein
VLACSPVGAVAADSEGVTRCILVIHSYSQDYQWTSGQHASFIQTLENGLPIAPTVKTKYSDLQSSYEKAFRKPHL